MEENSSSILVVDDNPEIREIIQVLLGGEGYLVETAGNGVKALEMLENREYDLIILDIMMPGMDGIAATAKIREMSNVPIILLTAKSEDSDKVLGLNIGADDYITKPFNPVEVLARVKSQLRRYTNLGSWSRKTGVFTAGGLQLDDETKTVTVDGDPVALTPIEYSILRLLIRSPGKVYSSGEIYRRIWNEMPLGSEGAVAVHVRHIREKIEINPSEPRYLQVVWGQGYKIAKQG